MSLSSDSDDMLMLNNGEDSSTFDDANSGRNMGRHSALKKGPWTSVEDAILVEYVTKHGEGNWNAVQKHSGLSRCGKSCRLRWANHLRPDLKKGAFTPEEERRIIELHAKMGNKWARMAAELPGRTDNEIKNYWNTRIKRRQRAGLPIYPPDVCIQAYNENQNDDMNPYLSGDMHHSDFIPVRFEIPAFKFKNSEPNQHMFPPPPLNMSVSSLLDTRPSSFLSQSLHPSYPNTCLVAGAKRFRGSESSVPGLSAETFMFPAAYGSNSTSNHASSSTALLSGSHATLNGNPSSSSEPPWAPKHPELPSLQNLTGRWCVSPSSPLPPLESVDTFRTPPTGNIHSHNFSQRNSGLLDAVLYESQSLRNLDSNSGPKISSARDVVVNNTSEDPYAVEWEAYSESIPPLCQSTSIFSDRAPVSGNLMDELQSVHHTKGCKVQYESGLGSIHHHNYAELQNHMSFHRPDLLLDSSCYIPQDTNKDHILLKDTIGSLVDDLNRDCMSTI